MAVTSLLSLILIIFAPGVALSQSYTASDINTVTTSSGESQFTIPFDVDEGKNVIPNIRDPQAVDPQSVCPGYTASHVDVTSSGLTAYLELAGEACNVYGSDVQNLALTVEHQSSKRLHVQIQPRYIGQENSSWFILPETLVPKPAAEVESAPVTDLSFEWENAPSFGFTVKRNSTGDVLFTTTGSVLVYEDQFIEFGSSLPDSYNLYGLGEVFRGLRLGNNLTRTLFAADVGDPVDENIYGSHPIYYDTRYFEVDKETGAESYVANATDFSARYTSYTHGVFLRNAHPQEILLRESNITWRTLGGSVDLYFYAGPTQSDVAADYQKSTVGLPALQQYWTFGFHQCRWGYQNWTVLQEIVDDFAAAEIPLETIWTDIDYMNQYRDFDNDNNTFDYDEGAKFLAKLHSNNQHYVPIVDSAIYVPNPENMSDSYAPFNRGADADAFMLNPDGSLYIGAVWPGYTVFPDWIGSSLNGTGAFEWWKGEVQTYYEKIAFDGIWIDMSEVSSFCVGSCGSNNLTLNPAHPPFLLPGEPGNVDYGYPEGFSRTNATEAASASSASSAQASAAATSGTATTSSSSTPYYRTTPTPGVRNVDHPPYVINNVQGDLAVHAVSPNATHHGGVQEYDVHNLFGHQILNATYQALLSVFPGKRPFIIGRSTFAGSGKWAGHWGGDNHSRWADLFFSIPQALSFGLFGVPMFGVDTCGFAGNADLELCSRWMQLSAFFPFYRNHNVLGTRPQEPYRWAAVAEASRAAMGARYALLPYLDTLFALAHASGSTVMRALAWEFPAEPWLAAADRQFLLGGCLMVAPCLVPGADSVGVVFPGVVGGGAGAGASGAVWYDWYTGGAASEGVGPGENVSVAAPLGHIPLFVRGGSVVPTQRPGLTTAASRRNAWEVIVALGADGKARGTLYRDDGESLEPTERTWVEFEVASSSLTATAEGNYTDPTRLAKVTVMGVKSAPPLVSFNGKGVVNGSWSHNSTSHVLVVTDLEELTASGVWAAGKWRMAWS